MLVLVCPVAALARAPHPNAPRADASRDDPWERFNRRAFAMNLAVDKAVIRPLSKVTSGLTPGPIGKMIHNFLVNLNEPVVIVNDLLQARPVSAFKSAFRLVVNTTAGGLGAIDVAKALGDPAHVNGFGDTLGRWGAVPGPYLVLPVFGPSDFRDAIGSLVDDVTLPFQTVSYPYRTEVTATVAVVGGLNERQEVAKEYDTLLTDATDPYATLRSTYLQSREAQIRGVKAPPVLPDIDESPEPTAPAPPSAPEASQPAPPKPPPPEGRADADTGAPAPPTPRAEFVGMRGLY
jgi:phospholipid-binding lipoprotein MlaA